MAYQIRFTDNINKSPLTVEDNNNNDSTSLSFPGRNVTGYGQAIGENFLHLLENFANTEPPDNPVEGQLWYDNTLGVNQLKIYDGTLWAAAGGLKKGSVEPLGTSSIAGDLWVNTDTQQLYLFTGSGWILVGPRFSSGARTGAEPEVIIDTLNQSQSVVSQYVAGERVAIISKTDFTPKTLISGFPTIKAGVNLNSSYNTYWGTAERARNLLVGTTVVPSSNFLRSDATSNTDYPINIRNSSGLSLGEDSQFNFSLDGNVGVITNRISGSSIDFRIDNNGSIRTMIRVDSSERVGIKNTNPQSELDVGGSIQASGAIRSTSATNSTSPTTGALIVTGGAGIGNDLYVGGDISVVGDLLSANDIKPNIDLGANLGSDTQRFNRVFASRFDGSFYGTVYGNLVGSASLSASKLASATTFRLEGDITSDNVEFDGQTGGSLKIFDTQLSETFIADKPEVSSIAENDEFVVSRGIEGLKKIKKTNLWTAISRTPIGSINAFAGSTSPTGWLLCDGSEVLISLYPELFDVIGYTYGISSSLLGVGTFKLPDLRGRFALGLDNMTSGITVPSKVNPAINISTGGGSANRVTDTTADNIGLSGGAESREIELENLPDHEHNMRGSTGNQYYAFRNISGTPPDINAVSGQGSTDANLGQYLPTSGGVLTDGALGQPIPIMNPYIALNYIIFTGRDVS